MISLLRGTIHRLEPGQAIVDVQGVGYGVEMPKTDWDGLTEGNEHQLFTYTYVREDRLELFGFSEKQSKQLFVQLIAVNGVGPKMALELCDVPRELLAQAVHTQDPALLSTVKGIGKKKAEKLLIELKSLFEKDPSLGAVSGTASEASELDTDALDALKTLGYDTPTVLQILQNLPKDLDTTEQRVTAALRSL